MRRTAACLVTALAVTVPMLGATPALAADKVQPTISISGAPTTLDPAHPAATISGTVTDTADGHALAGVPVDLSTNSGWGTVTDATTDESGQFTATLRPNTESDAVHVWAVTPESTTQNAAQSQMLTFAVNAGKPVLTINADRTSTDAGQPVKLSGTLTNDGAPLASRWVQITSDVGSCDGVEELPALTTAADGSYEITARPLCSVRSFTATSKPAGLYKPATASTGAVTVRQPTDISATASIDKYGLVTVSAGLSGRNTYVSYDGQRAQVQYSLNGKSGWKTVRRFNLSGDNFTTQIQYNQSGYWRVTFDGNAVAMPGQSAAKKAWRWNTHFTNFKVSPRSLKFKAKTTVSGALIRYTAPGKKKGYANQKVYIYFTCKSDKREVWYTDSGWVRTNSKGWFKKSVRAYCTGNFLVIYNGSTDTFAAGSKTIPIKVSGTPRGMSATANPNAAGEQGRTGGFTPSSPLLRLLGVPQPGQQPAAIG